MKRALTLAVVLFAAAVAPATAQADPSQFGLVSASASLSTNQAGGHPDFSTAFEVATDPASEPNGFGLKEPFAALRDATVDLPPGLIGNPNAVAQCTVAQLENFQLPEGGCPNASQVGVTTIYAYGVERVFTEPVYLMRPPADESSVARLGFIAAVVPTFIEAQLRSEGDYGIEAVVERASSLQRLVKAETTLWGVPAAKAHDTERQTPIEAFNGATSSPPRSPCGSSACPTASQKPFMTNPTRCGVPLSVDFAVDSYSEPGRFSTMEAPLGSMAGCDQITFSPTLSLTPTSRQAAEPTGLDAELTIPQQETVGSLATSQLRYARVTLPEGVTIASGAGDGLQACSASDVGLGTRKASDCPDASKIGTAQIVSPALSRPLEGAVYQRTPVKGDLFGLWLVADELGVHIKLPAEVHVDSQTGQIETLFEGTPATEGNPQTPVSSFKLHFKSGPRAPLTAPSVCGTYAAHYEFVPWSGRPPAQEDVPMTFDQGCGTGGFSPQLSAGSVNPLAGAFSPFLTALTVGPGQQNVSTLDVTLPKGVLAKLAGVGLCEGVDAENGTCPAASQIGTAAVAAGPGPSPLWLPQPGKEPISIFLSGPYKGAPYSLVVKTPAQAGPFDLGTVITRAGIYVDPDTAEATVHSDPLPQILEGVPVSYRTIHVAVDRPEFIVNPTSCAQKQAQATVTSIDGATATPSAPYRVGGCRGLAFKPALSLTLKGGTKRGMDPALKAVLKARPGDANIGAAQVALPHSEFLDNAHIKTICTRVQFAARQCPAGSIYGHARAVSPLLDQPLEGPVYLRSSNHELPDLVADLNGQIHVVLDGRIDSVNGGIRSTFEAVPDAAVTKFVLAMAGGKKGLIENSTDLCASAHHATAKFTGQNGKVDVFHPALAASCRKAHKRKRAHPKR